MSSQALRPTERIRRRSEFERAYSQGTRVHGRFMTLFVVPNGGDHPRIGVAATKKLGSAVERNRAKRLAREVFRRQKISGGCDIVIVPRREMLDEPFANLEADYRAALDRRGRTPGRTSAGSTGRGGRSRAASRL